jgi:hypothetical protein
MTTPKHDAVGETLNQFYLGRINIYEAKRELLELVKRSLPGKKKICNGVERVEDQWRLVGYNQCYEKTLANIERLFKGEGE